ncbi:hypothetical protein WMY93_026125 [Mugilogobius chulae]|uniref:Uncharacterized protein n=1 Tax=Mugilogobius chulae TaxID=88201 RepID=A0AAW0N011_9GOBI
MSKSSPKSSSKSLTLKSNSRPKPVPHKSKSSSKVHSDSVVHGASVSTTLPSTPNSSFGLAWTPAAKKQTHIQFKVLLITLKALHNLAPPDLTDLLHRYTTARSLRFSDSNLLLLPCRIRLRTWGNRTFSIAAPNQWNMLPQQLRDCTDLTTFKKNLKTQLFKSDFNV